MIGDHQQLKPSATVYELAKRYNLDISLFERMVKNGLPFDILEYQHRMRPSISRLIVPTIYESLKDHSSVSDREHIKGVTKDVFFIDHDHFEKLKADDNNSHENDHEAGLIIALCHYLVLQGYEQDKITILTPYSGQFFLLKKKQRAYYTTCLDVKISIVDNFQGEENDIILLSLVRSNPQAIVGFLKTENRVCVALSRAKMGLYICGNMEQLCQSSELWKKIRTTLEENDCIGKTMKLKCTVHPDIYSYVSSEQDIMEKSPEGGCKLKCGNILACGHTCYRICHSWDRKHKVLRCKSSCSRTCSFKHPCPKVCYQKCDPCSVPIMRELPCGHSKELQCCINPSDYLCKEIINRNLQDCGHENQIECSADVNEHKCSFPCEIRLDCGHQCRRNCHVKIDPDHEHYRCEEPCALLNRGCTVNHQCNKKCYEPCGDCIAPVSKTLPCGHTHCKVPCHQEIKCHYKCQKKLDCGHPCPMECSEPCGNCEILVDKIVPDCNHTAKVKCSKESSLSDCYGRCQKTLPCGHPCKNLCKDTCTPNCAVVVPEALTCPNNHSISLPCHVNVNSPDYEAWLYCKEPCNAQLECGHTCKGQCGACLHGRLHVPCQEKCGRQLSCGHMCASLCGEDCLPCDQKCLFECSHGKSKNMCGMPYTPCLKKCKRSCPHRKCKSNCGNICSVTPCDKPCNNILACGHSCIGFCGEVCPSECRFCDRDKLIENLLNYEQGNNVRFIKLLDCGHTIESNTLHALMNTKTNEVGMKKCPKCQSAIYNCSRYKRAIVDSYWGVCQVTAINLWQQSRQLKERIFEELEDIGLFTRYQDQRTAIMTKSGTDPNMSQKARKRLVPDPQLKVCLFKAQILRRVAELDGLHSRSPSFNETKFLLDHVVARLGQIGGKVSLQTYEGFWWELKRLSLLPSIARLNRQCTDGCEGAKICAQISAILTPSAKLNSDMELKVRSLLKDAEKYASGLGIPSEGGEINTQATGQQGDWYRCPKNHFYSLAECRGASVGSICPKCAQRAQPSKY